MELASKIGITLAVLSLFFFVFAIIVGYNILLSIAFIGFVVGSFITVFAILFDTWRG